LICIDFSWASIHACLSGFNNESAIEYSNRIFFISNPNTIDDDSNKTLLVSCVAHTMKRFSKSIESFSINQTFHPFAMYAFSILVNTKDLLSMKKLNSLITIIFLSKTTNTLYNDAYNEINYIIKNRDEKQEETEYTQDDDSQDDDSLPSSLIKQHHFIKFSLIFVQMSNKNYKN
jgi:hypothetical protein